jgi:catechol 2,3-dioxygenase-like lactoylglutathione lyase family enzyme
MSAHFAAIGLVVADMAASIDFYRRLGLELPDDVADQPHVEAELPGGLRLMFDTVETARSIDPNWTAPSGGPGAALAFECESPADVDAVYEALTSAGAVGHVPPWDAVWGQRYALVHDPDGNGVDLFAAL